MKQTLGAKQTWRKYAQVIKMLVLETYFSIIMCDRFKWDIGNKFSLDYEIHKTTYLS